MRQAPRSRAMNAPRHLSEAKLVLASASPRRSELLERLGLSFTVHASGVDEDAASPPGATPEELVQVLALVKAQDIAKQHPEADLVLGADTIVVLDGQVLGKPKDVADAEATLARLQGQWHTVHTGQALVVPGGAVVQTVTTSKVKIAALGPEAIARYVATGEPMDKAGSYAIQGIGAGFVEANEGCYTTIMGLGLPTFLGLAARLGWTWP